MRVFYTDIDKYCCNALYHLGNADKIPFGDVECVDINNIKTDLSLYSQSHFFAGIGGWALALKMAGFPQNINVWTGSCPCQPFTNQGKGLGFSDERHLFPAWLKLIKKYEPTVIFGEQVANAITYGWLDEVSNALGGAGYEIGTAILPACSVAAPHKRSRLFFVATNNWGKRGKGRGEIKVPWEPTFSWCKDVRGIEDLRNRPHVSEPLVRKYSNGVSNGLAELHAFGNAIVPEVAAYFIKAFMDVYL